MRTCSAGVRKPLMTSSVGSAALMVAANTARIRLAVSVAWLTGRVPTAEAGR